CSWRGCSSLCAVQWSIGVRDDPIVCASGRSAIPKAPSVKRHPHLWMVVAFCLTGCVRALPPTMQSMSAIVIFPANNRTGDPLLIAGGSFFEKYVVPTERYTVADALAAEARSVLVQHGFGVLAPQAVDVASNGQIPASAADAATLAARSH